MAILRTNAPIDMTTASSEPVFLEVVEATETRITASDGFFTDIYRGSFQYDQFGNVFGKLDQVVSFAGNDPLGSIIDINRDAHQASIYLLNGMFFSFEAYVFSGSDQINGSRFGDILLGFSGDDILVGNPGNDRLLGGNGSDQLVAGVGSDVLNGGTSADLMQGGAGDDQYIVDNSGDRVVELTDEGSDLVRATISFILTANVESLSLAGLEAITGTGNALGNSMRGNNTNNILSGGFGNDLILGAGGGDNIIPGANADDIAGGADADIFIFRFVRDCGKGAERDVILDFQHGADRLHLANIDANYKVDGDQAFSFIGQGAFSSTAGELRYADGIVSGDVNGDGTADFEIDFANHANLTAMDVLL